MIDRLTSDRIIIPSNKKMGEAINWYEENSDILDKQEFPTPFNSGVIDFVEESIELAFEVKDNIIEMAIYPKRVEDLKREHNKLDVSVLSKRYVCKFNYNPSTKVIDHIVFPEGLDKVARYVLMTVTMEDDTINKCCFKFRALMFYTVYFKNSVIKSNRMVKLSSKKHRKSKNKKKPQKLVQTIYTLDEQFNADSSVKLKRAYTLPQTEVKVRGHYRHYKSGKTVWIKPSVKYKDKEHIRKEYEL